MHGSWGSSPEALTQSVSRVLRLGVGGGDLVTPHGGLWTWAALGQQGGRLPLLPEGSSHSWAPQPALNMVNTEVWLGGSSVSVSVAPTGPEPSPSSAQATPPGALSLHN